MQKLTIDINTPVAVIKDGKPVVEYKKEKRIAIVASTKSQNNLIAELKESGENVGNVSVQDLYLDKEKTRSAISAYVEKELEKESPEIRKAVATHIFNAVNGACVFYNPIKRK